MRLFIKIAIVSRYLYQMEIEITINKPFKWQALLMAWNKIAEADKTVEENNFWLKMHIRCMTIIKVRFEVFKPRIWYPEATEAERAV